MTTMIGVNQYDEFVRRKFALKASAGIEDDCASYGLFPHQVALSTWALRRGKAAIFAETGLGKSRMQVAWADAVVRHTGGDVLILAPLAVADQTVAEGESIGVRIVHDRSCGIHAGITIANYERLHKFDTRRFAGVVLDESSIIKHHGAKTLQSLLNAFGGTPYKLCATATPAPNDWTELGNHAQFLDVCSRAEMLSEFFVHDGGDTQVWRLKGHARSAFWQWVASWGAMVRSPADLGFDGSAYELPPIVMHQHQIETPVDMKMGLFQFEAQTLSERRDARRATIDQRVRACADIVNATEGPWVVWCDLNAEGDALTKAIGGAVQIAGANTIEEKEDRLRSFARGATRVLVSKPSICGFGLNWQHCANMAFVGVTDSFESYYQAVRRCWRFGQTRPVNVHVFASDKEGAIVANLRRKEIDAAEMAQAMSAETMASVHAQVMGRARSSNEHNASKRVGIPTFLMEA
jgi:hypothetical protein